MLKNRDRVDIHVKSAIYGTKVLYGTIYSINNGFLNLDWDGKGVDVPEFHSIYIPIENIIFINLIEEYLHPSTLRSSSRVDLGAN